MSFFMNILMFAGLVLMVMGLVEVVRRVPWGDAFGGGVSDVREVMRLQELNRKIRDDITETSTCADNCFKIFRILASTTFRDMTQSALFVLRDGTWKRAREKTLACAKKGYRDSDRFVRLSMDSAMLLLREAFRYSIQTCMNCPLARGRAEELKCCPITETLKTETEQSRPQ
jgi:hypothetical protein